MHLHWNSVNLKKFIKVVDNHVHELKAQAAAKQSSLLFSHLVNFFLRLLYHEADKNY